jgi:ribosomal protein S18 acetylase RimI-like enzyme
MRVETATHEDVEAIERVARASWEHDYPKILSSESLQSGVEEWYSADHIRDSVDWPRASVLVARDGDTVVGFVHAVLDADRDEGNLLRLYVGPDHRGRGVGTALFEAVREELSGRGADRLRAMVLAANEVGNGFYEHLGFERVGTSETTVGGETYTEHTYVRSPAEP